MEIQEISVEIDGRGNVKIGVQGMQGTSCLEATAALEAALGEVAERTMRPEAYDEAVVRTDERWHIGSEG